MFSFRMCQEPVRRETTEGSWFWNLFVCFHLTELGRAKKRAWKTKEYVLQKLVTEKRNAGWQFSRKKHEKIRKMCRNDLRAFALRNYTEGFKTKKKNPFRPAAVLNDNAQSWKIVRKMNSWPRSEASRKTMKFSGQYFFQPRALSREGGRGTPRKIGWGCAARFLKPLSYLWPDSAIFSTLFMTWPKIWYPTYDLTLKSTPCFGPALKLFP